jgi:hypothetical protein
VVVVALDVLHGWQRRGWMDLVCAYS